jgi:hypothetical protein
MDLKLLNFLAKIRCNLLSTHPNSEYNAFRWLILLRGNSRAFRHKKKLFIVFGIQIDTLLFNIHE